MNIETLSVCGELLSILILHKLFLIYDPNITRENEREKEKERQRSLILNPNRHQRDKKRTHCCLLVI